MSDERRSAMGVECATSGCTREAEERSSYCRQCYADCIKGLLPRPQASSRPSFHEVCIDLAKSISRRSTCSRLQVGCVITSIDFRKVIAWGYNGGASGLENECASIEPGQCGHLHAEANAIINCDVPRATEKRVFVTDLPCAMCSKMLINLGGVREVVYARDYRIKDGLELLKRAGISTVCWIDNP